MTLEEQWEYVLKKRQKILQKGNRNVVDNNFLEVYNLIVVNDEMPADGHVYFLYSAASRIKDGLFS
jgi:hypothetical protein